MELSRSALIRKQYLELVKEHPEGLPLETAAARLGCHVSTITRIRRREGLSTPQPEKRPGRVMTEEDIQWMGDLLDEGGSYATVSRELGCAPNTVSRHYPGRGARPPMTPITEEEKAEMQDLLDDGESYESVARLTGRSHNTVRRYFPGYGWDKERIAAENTARAALNKTLY